MDIQKLFPKLQGKIIENHPLSKSTWFQVGGPARYYFKPKDIDDLIYFLENKPHNLRIEIIGAGSNVLVRDEGVDACIIRLGAGFSEITNQDDILVCGAACLDRTVAIKARDYDLSNLEFLVGIPGTIGGAVAMNAGAYGSEIKDHLLWVEIVDFNGTVSTVKGTQLHMHYRKGNLPQDVIVTRAAFQMKHESNRVISTTLNDFLNAREDAQPTRGRTGGSTFKNPFDTKAWELIDAAGCRGLKYGDAQISEKHCNFLLNLGNAKAIEIETLGEMVREKVKQHAGVDLEWEIIRLGLPAKEELKNLD